MSPFASIRMRRSRAFAVFLVLASGSLAACAKRVTRVDPASVTDLSGRWNDTDSRLVANELIRQTLTEAWLSRHTATHAGESPVVLIGAFRNGTLEHIPVETFVKDLERAFVNSGAVRVVASAAERSEIRDERNDQQENARVDTRARLARELGADYLLQGSIEAIEDQEGREKIVFYQIDASLVDVESNVKVWTGQHKIKKYIERGRIRF